MRRLGFGVTTRRLEVGELEFFEEGVNLDVRRN